MHKLKFIDSYRFIQDSLSNLVDNLSEINNKEPKDNMSSMIDSLLQSVNKISKIDQKISLIDRIEAEINLQIILDL